jgi:glutamate N-acetyltransferase/amino-acid N-acetyltransferase
MLAVLAPGSVIAGVLTKSKTASAPVEWCRKNLSRGKARAIIVNAGNANAFTGKAGDRSVDEATRAVAAALKCARNEVFMASTGVIGQPLTTEKIVAAVPALAKAVNAEGWAAAARSIMTTDTFPKLATQRAHIGDAVVTINGFCKGSGMIAPDMATMLGFAFTDAKIPAPILQEILRAAADKSFNCITVDSDTSTSDTFLLAATGLARHPRVIEANDPGLADFRRAVDALMIDLAQQVVKDGEGASKFIAITVTGATSNNAARKIGLSIANSPLVKTAIAGEDANWGRIVMAVGKSGEKADRDKLGISIGGVQITANGQVVPKYDETPVAQHIKGRHIDIGVDIGLGRGKAVVWTCDLTHGYIDINGSYRS